MEVGVSLFFLWLILKIWGLIFVVRVVGFFYRNLVKVVLLYNLLGFVLSRGYNG